MISVRLVVFSFYRGGDIIKAKNKNAVIFVNGELHSWDKTENTLKREYGFKKDTYIVAADGGVENCMKAGVMPDTVMGDMDSIDEGHRQFIRSSKKDVDFLEFEAEKDQSDTQLTLEHTVKEVTGKIALVGALGGRLDHTLANIYLLAAPFAIDRDIYLLGDKDEIQVTKRPIELKGITGKRLTLISLSPYTYFKSTDGLKYGLSEEKLLFSPVRGLSNEFLSDRAAIEITEGLLLIIKEL